MADLKELLTYAFREHPDRISAFALSGLLLDAAKHSRARPGWVKLAVPDAIVRNMFGRSTLRDEYILIQVPREVAEAASAE